MEILNSFFNWVMSKRISQIEHFMANPYEVQDQVFQYLVKTAKSTEWGKKYHYHEITSSQQFRERVPVSTYEQFYPYIERLLKGEQELLWPTEVKCFAKSSGTTNARSKFIPITKESLDDCHYKAGKDLLSIYVNRYPRNPLFFRKKPGHWR